MILYHYNSKREYISIRMKYVIILCEFGGISNGHAGKKKTNHRWDTSSLYMSNGEEFALVELGLWEAEIVRLSGSVDEPLNGARAPLCAP